MPRGEKKQGNREKRERARVLLFGKTSKSEEYIEEEMSIIQKRAKTTEHWDSRKKDIGPARVGDIVEMKSGFYNRPGLCFLILAVHREGVVMKPMCFSASEMGDWWIVQEWLVGREDADVLKRAIESKSEEEINKMEKSELKRMLLMVWFQAGRLCKGGREGRFRSVTRALSMNNEVYFGLIVREHISNFENDGYNILARREAVEVEESVLQTRPPTGEYGNTIVCEVSKVSSSNCDNGELSGWNVFATPDPSRIPIEDRVGNRNTTTTTTTTIMSWKNLSVSENKDGIQTGDNENLIADKTHVDIMDDSTYEWNVFSTPAAP